MSAHFIYLASQSPRRAELLRQLGLRFEVLDVNVDETPRAGEAAEACVTRLARAKVEAARARLGRGRSAPILAADTAVALDQVIFGKPRDRNEALEMLARLSGRSHRVLSAVAVWGADALRTALSISQVTFRAINAAEAAAYWETGEPEGKAGGYAIQGRGAVFVERLEGSYSGVMGLPLYETAQLLRAAGVTVLRGEA
ncbi:MAG TPA: Maf family protein [Gammaproteobacteria bacterium]|nr:Maf family protein [Gammaproteobacteria bacterium]